MPYGITQCYLPPSTGDIFTLYLCSPSGVRLFLDLLCNYLTLWLAMYSALNSGNNTSTGLNFCTLCYKWFSLFPYYFSRLNLIFQYLSISSLVHSPYSFLHFHKNQPIKCRVIEFKETNKQWWKKYHAKYGEDNIIPNNKLSGDRSNYHTSGTTEDNANYATGTQNASSLKHRKHWADLGQPMNWK